MLILFTASSLMILIVPDMLIDLFLNLNTLYSRWPTRMRITIKIRPRLPTHP
jgi:hypothetical protein